MPDHNESAEEAVSRLTKELDELKLRLAAVGEERDRLAEKNFDLRTELDELETARVTMNGVVDELQSSMEALRDSMEQYNELLELPEVKLYLAGMRRPV